MQLCHGAACEPAAALGRSRSNVSCPFHERVGRVNCQRLIARAWRLGADPAGCFGLRRLPSALVEGLARRPVHLGIRPIRRCDLSSGQRPAGGSPRSVAHLIP